VRDEGGDVIAERAAPLGKASNNVAEYSGLIAGLEAAEVIDPGARITVAMDSKLVVEQMSGRWKIKHADMRTLALEAKEIIERIVAAGGSVDFTWIPRERNKAADALSNDGMDGVSHRAALLAVLDAVLGLASPWSLALAPASLTALRQWGDGVASVDFVNDQGHLRG
jgi:ribonuclease HI